MAKKHRSTKFVEGEIIGGRQCHRIWCCMVLWMGVMCLWGFGVFFCIGGSAEYVKGVSDVILCMWFLIMDLRIPATHILGTWSSAFFFYISFPPCSPFNLPADFGAGFFVRSAVASANVQSSFPHYLIEEIVLSRLLTL